MRLTDTSEVELTRVHEPLYEVGGGVGMTPKF